MRKIKGFDDYYIDEYGRVYSTKTGQIRELKPWADSKGRYMIIGLCVNNKVTKKLVHRLVAQAFIPNPNNLPEINHKDTNPQNNRIDNLEWCDRQYNMEQAFMVVPPTRNYIECYLTYDGECIGEFHTKKDACEYASSNLGASYTSLMKYNRSKGYELAERCNDYPKGE